MGMGLPRGHRDAHVVRRDDQRLVALREHGRRDKVATTPYPKIETINDGQGVPDTLGRYAANPWGLKDMHGSVAEWTRSSYRAYPYKDSDGRNDAQARDEKVVRGGSWSDRPFRCTSSFRLPYQPWQRVANVGFRIIIEDAP